MKMDWKKNLKKTVKELMAYEPEKIILLFAEVILKEGKVLYEKR